MHDYGLTESDATSLTQSKPLANYFQQLAHQEPPINLKIGTNWIRGEVSRLLNAQDISIDACPVSPFTLAALIRRIADGTISNNAAKQVFDALWNGEGTDVGALIEAKGLKQMSDSGELEKIIDDVLATNAKNVEEVKAGNSKAMNALVGQAMKATKGKANPAQVNELLKKKLG